MPDPCQVIRTHASKTLKNIFKFFSSLKPSTKSKMFILAVICKYLAFIYLSWSYSCCDFQVLMPQKTCLFKKFIAPNMVDWESSLIYPYKQHLMCLNFISTWCLKCCSVFVYAHKFGNVIWKSLKSPFFCFKH